MPTLFDPLAIGAIAAPNRVLMAPLTRNRASAGQVPNELMRDHYVQRAAAGLIISEATQISPSAQGYLATPGIHDEGQVAGWRVITDAVHAAGGRMVCQLWHVGRISHVSLQPGGVAPVSSTARAAAGQTYTANGFEPVSAPRALAADELPGIVDDYRRATANALRAGFDGVEIHAANGYLLEQFLRDSINDRDDAYGGSIDNRCRFPLDVVRAVVSAAGAERTGIRLSPVTSVNDAAQDSDAASLYGHFVSALAALRLAYVHVVEGTTGGRVAASRSTTTRCAALTRRPTRRASGSSITATTVPSRSTGWPRVRPTPWRSAGRSSRTPISSPASPTTGLWPSPIGRPCTAVARQATSITRSTAAPDRPPPIVNRPAGNTLAGSRPSDSSSSSRPSRPSRPSSDKECP